MKLKVLFNFIIASCVAVCAWAEKTLDTIQYNSVRLTYDSLQKLSDLGRYSDSTKILGWADSMRFKVNNHFAKGQGQLSHAIDSLNRINFSNNRYLKKADSLIKFTNPSSREFYRLTAKIDSVKRIQLPISNYQKKADSLMNKHGELIGEINSKQKNLEQKVTSRYTEWNMSLRNKLKLDSLGIKAVGEVPGLKGLNKSTGSIPGSTPNIGNSLNRVQIPGLSTIPTLNTQDFSDLGLSKELSGIGGRLSIPSTNQLKQWDLKMPGLMHPLKGASQQIKQASSMIKDPSKTAEGAVGQLGEVKGLNAEVANLEKLKQENEALQLADKMKSQEAMEGEAKKLAVNHFAGKEAVLKNSMNQISKYKKKYSSIASLSEIKDKWWQPVNSLKGVSFRERLRPGINIGLKSTKDTLVLDFYPNVAYEISGRLEAGAGAIYRLREKDFQLDQKNPVWGFTAFTTFNLFKSTRLRLETDATSNPLPPTSTEAPVERVWRWQFVAGIQNSFKISKSWLGNVQLLYNFDKKLKDAFPEKLSVRVGFQFKFRKRKPGK